MLRIRTRYSLTCSSRSSAARANPLISRVFCPQSPMSRHAVPSLRRSRYSSTPAAVDCLTCHVCVRARSPSPSTPLAPWKRRYQFATLPCTDRVPVQTANTCLRFQAFADVIVRRISIRLAGILLACLLRPVRGARPPADRELLFHDSPGPTRLHRRGAVAD